MAENQRRRIVVAGATGYAGGAVVRAAHDAGHWVRALVRDPSRLGALSECCDDVFVAEATQPDTLQGLCDGADAVFSSIGIRHLKRRPTIWQVDQQANLNLVEAAQRAKIRDFVFLSVLHGPKMRNRVPVAEARERVVDALRSSDLNWAVLRPTGFFNDMLEFLQMADAGRVWLMGDGSSRINPIHGADIAAQVLQLLEEGFEVGHSRDLGGPDTFTLRQIGELAFKTVGKPPRFGKIPIGLLRTVATVATPFNQNAAAILAMFAAFGDTDGTAPVAGSHHLADWYSEQTGRSQ